MSFFRRAEDGGRSAHGDPRSWDGREAASRSAGEREPSPDAGQTPPDYQAFGGVVEESQKSSEELLSGLGFLQNRVSALLGAHGDALRELGSLRTEQARVASLLEYESTARRRLDGENSRNAAENRDLRVENAQLRVESESGREALIKLQAVHEVNARELSLIQGRLRDAERELEERVLQYDETASLLRRAHQDIEVRNREFASLREKFDTEKTAHVLLIETSRREVESMTRDITRLNEEKSQLKIGLAHQENLARNYLAELNGVRQELSISVEMNKRLQSELENHQSATAVEMSQLVTRHEAINSKSELVEKLLMTARGRSKMSEDELLLVRSELKQVKNELASTSQRSERLAQELANARAAGAETEAMRRELSMQCSELTNRLRDSDVTRGKRDRDAEMMKRDGDQRAQADREEIRQLRASAEVAKAEIVQLRSEVAILGGQLDVARSERIGAMAYSPRMPHVEDEPWLAAPEFAAPRPIIEISEKSLRASSLPDA